MNVHVHVCTVHIVCHSSIQSVLAIESGRTSLTTRYVPTRLLYCLHQFQRCSLCRKIKDTSWRYNIKTLYYTFKDTWIKYYPIHGNKILISFS